MRLGVTDLKSAPRKGVWVRLPSSAPTQRSQCTEDAREPRSPARIFRGNVSLLTGLDRRTRLKTKPGGGPGGPFFDPGGRSLRSVTNRVGLSRNGLCPQWFFFQSDIKADRGNTAHERDPDKGRDGSPRRIGVCRARHRAGERRLITA